MVSQAFGKRKYVALAPLVSLAGIFIHPVASTISPLALFFIFRKSKPDVGVVALKTADLAFSVQLWIMLISLALMLGVSTGLVTPNETRQMMEMAISLILLIFVVSLLFAVYQVLRGKDFSYFFSFKIAERVLGFVKKR